MKDVLGKPEEAIERVLVGLREVEAAPGMERRVLERLEAQALPQRETAGQVQLPLGHGGRGWWTFAELRRVLQGVVDWRMALGMAVLGVMVAGGLVAVSRVMRSRAVVPRVAVQRTGGPGVRKGFGSEGEGAGSNEVALSGARVRPGFDTHRMAGGVAAARGSAGAMGVARGGGGVKQHVGDDRLLVSFPAPPLPLTEQERLLLRVVHRGDTEELAMLDPAVQLMEVMEERAQFKEFFEPVVAGAQAEEHEIVIPAEVTKLLAAEPINAIPTPATNRVPKKIARPRGKKEMQ